MKTISKFTLATLLAAGLFAVSANASLVSSKAALINASQVRPATATLAAKSVDTASISSKAEKAPGTAKTVTVARTQNCSKPMDMASATCEMHCR